MNAVFCCNRVSLSASQHLWDFNLNFTSTTVVPKIILIKNLFFGGMEKNQQIKIRKKFCNLAPIKKKIKSYPPTKCWLFYKDRLFLPEL